MTIQTLIVHDHNIENAKKVALDIDGELEARKSHYRVHTKSNFEIENLRSHHSFDLNINLKIHICFSALEIICFNQCCKMMSLFHT